MWGGHSCPPPLTLSLNLLFGEPIWFLGSRKIKINVKAADRACPELVEGSVRPTCLLSQFLCQQLIHQLRAGLAFGGFHDLPYEEAEHGGFSGAILL
jgi:hypothetical protein